MIYKSLMAKGYHPIRWRKAIGVILKKSGKRNPSTPRAYRIISLLNCLGKVIEKIVATRLAEIAENSDLLYFDQMGGRKEKSAIDTVMSMIHDTQIAKQQGKKITTALFIDVKGAFDHVSANQLLQTCINLGLPKCVCNWIECFLEKRQIQLAFDNEKCQMKDIEIGIPQGSPISPILFLIYIRNIFHNKNQLKEMQIREPSYIDDIAIYTSSNSFAKNCETLKKAAMEIFQKGNENCIKFDPEKVELIHFHNRRNVEETQIGIQFHN